MLLSWGKLAKGRHRQEPSPFVSSFTGLLSSPVAARPSSLEERGRPTIDFDRNIPHSLDGKVDEEPEEEQEDEGDADNLDEDADEDGDEDGDEEITPLLPIFSAAHLGSYSSHPCA